MALSQGLENLASHSQAANLNSFRLEEVDLEKDLLSHQDVAAATAMGVLTVLIFETNWPGGPP